MEVPLGFVLGIEGRISGRADEGAARGGPLQQRDVVDINAGGLGRVEDVRHVYEDGDVLAHKWTPLISWAERLAPSRNSPSGVVSPWPDVPAGWLVRSIVHRSRAKSPLRHARHGRGPWLSPIRRVATQDQRRASAWPANRGPWFG